MRFVCAIVALTLALPVFGNPPVVIPPKVPPVNQQARLARLIRLQQLRALQAQRFAFAQQAQFYAPAQAQFYAQPALQAFAAQDYCVPQQAQILQAPVGGCAQAGLQFAPQSYYSGGSFLQSGLYGQSLGFGQGLYGQVGLRGFNRLSLNAGRLSIGRGLLLRTLGLGLGLGF